MIGFGRGADGVVGAALLGTVTLPPLFATYAALCPAGPVRRSPVGGWLSAVLLTVTGLGDLWGGARPGPRTGGPTWTSRGTSGPPDGPRPDAAALGPTPPGEAVQPPNGYKRFFSFGGVTGSSL